MINRGLTVVYRGKFSTVYWTWIIDHFPFNYRNGHLNYFKNQFQLINIYQHVPVPSNIISRG